MSIFNKLFKNVIKNQYKGLKYEENSFISAFLALNREKWKNIDDISKKELIKVYEKNYKYDYK